jgi:hypothetical protein
MHWRIKVRAKMILSLRMIFNQGTFQGTKVLNGRLAAYRTPPLFY